MISLCIIVKNEEENLENCLSKVLDIVSEIIIVDTGSTDNTKNIATKFTDKIYDFKWCNDFSKARNFSVSKASNDWILVMDADEFITDFIKSNIDKFIKNPLNRSRVGRIRRINMIEDYTGSKKYTERINRLFNKNNYYYGGIIHEQLVALDGKSYETEIVDITVEHVGYTKKILTKTDKLKRNIDLLKLATQNDSGDPYLYFQLGKSYYMLKDYKTSVMYFEKALSFQLDLRLEYVEDLVETYGYSLINSGRYSDALVLEKYTKFYLKSSDFYFIMGLIYMNNARFDQAIKNFLKCTQFSHSRVDGITTYMSYYNIGVIYDVLGFEKKSQEYYLKCGNYEPALKRL